MPRFLVVEVAQARFALAVSDVIETMRPLAVEPVNGVPDYVLGLSIIRGIAVPVVDVARVLAIGSAELGRFVTVRAGTRTIALAVSAVLGVVHVDKEDVHAAPPLMDGTGLDQLAVRDGELFRILSGAKLIDDEAWLRLNERAHAH